MKKPSSHLRAICLAQADHEFRSPNELDRSIRESLISAYHTKLLECSPAHTWPGDAHLKSVPYPILATDIHLQRLEQLNDALFLAITDIVERWWTDTAARFPQRMPIEPVEEELLQWLQNQDPDIVRPFRTCSGSWRPDFLLEQSPVDPEEVENYRVCEINARFCWNGFLMTAYGQRAFDEMGIDDLGLQGAAEAQTIFNGLNRLYNASLPIHLVKGDEYGFDIHLVTSFAQRILGVCPRIIHPSDLRLVPCPEAPGGFDLYCLAGPGSSHLTIVNDAGETLEQVHQLGLELHQRELLAMSFEMLQQISLRCFNDMRTILLVHDKRMLGLVREELDSLVARNVLTPTQADTLDRGLVPTLIPGSERLKKLVERCKREDSLKDQYLLKPIRSGKGAGILFGDEVSSAEWISFLEHMQEPKLDENGPTYVVQCKIEQKTYGVLLREEDGIQQYPLIGTFHVVHGVLLGLGLWRSGPGRICALSRGGAWMCSVRKSSPAF